MPNREPDLQRILAKSINGGRMPKAVRPKRVVEPTGGIVTARLSPNMMEAVDTWRAKRGLSRADALVALAECGMRVFDHATRKRR